MWKTSLMYVVWPGIAVGTDAFPVLNVSAPTQLIKLLSSGVR